MPDERLPRCLLSSLLLLRLTALPKREERLPLTRHRPPVSSLQSTTTELGAIPAGIRLKTQIGADDKAPSVQSPWRTGPSAPSTFHLHTRRLIIIILVLGSTSDPPGAPSRSRNSVDQVLLSKPRKCFSFRPGRSSGTPAAAPLVDYSSDQRPK